MGMTTRPPTLTRDMPVPTFWTAPLRGALYVESTSSERGPSAERITLRNGAFKKAVALAPNPIEGSGGKGGLLSPNAPSVDGRALGSATSL